MATKLLAILLFTWLFFSPATTVYAITVVVSPGQSVQTAVNSAASGDVIEVRAGIYPTFTVSKNNLSILGYSGERPIIKGGAGIKLSGSDITLSGFEVTEMSARQSGAILSSGNRNLIKDNLVHDNLAPGTNGLIISGAHNRVESNMIYANNRMGLGIYNGSGNIITKNTVYKNTQSAGDSDGIHCLGDTTGQSHDNTISDNITYENADDGIDMWNCINNQVINNISHHNGGTGDGHGIKLGYGGSNTVKDNLSYSNQACGFTSNGSGNHYEHNTAHSNVECGFTDSFRIPGNTEPSSFINNVAYNNRVAYVRGQYTTVFTGNSESIPSFSPKSGDLNQDGVINLFDFNHLVTNFGHPYTIFDFNQLIANYGR